jgi:small-conductance mechanosensitive channel
VDPGSDITVRSQEALKALDRLRTEVEATGDAEQEADQVEELRSKVDGLLPEGQGVEDLTDDPAVLDGMLIRSRALTSQSGTLIDRLTGSAERLEAVLKEIRALIGEWQRVREEATNVPEALNDRVTDIIGGAQELEMRAGDKLNRVIELQNSAMAVRNLITPIEDRIDSYGRTHQTRLFEQNAAPIWKLTSEHISQSSQRTSRNLIGSLRRDFLSWVETSEASIGGHFLLLPLLLFVLFRLRRLTKETPRDALARPAASSILIWMLIGVVVYAGAPAAVRLVYVLIAMLMAGVLLVNFLPKSMRSGVIAFLAIALVEQLFSGFHITEHLPRLTYLILSIAFIALALLGRRPNTLASLITLGAPRPLVVGTLWVAIALASLSVLTNLIGYVHLTELLLGGTLSSIAVFLVLFAGLASISEIIEATLSLPVLDNVRSIAANRYRLKRALHRPLVLLSLFLWTWATARGFGIDGVLITALSNIFLAEVSIGQVTLSLRGIFVFVLAVWLAVWTSRIVRALLNQDLLPRMDLPRGIPNTISMTAHYSIIMIGLLLGVGFMGIDLSSLAFVVGALGVGIGFGLQNVVNNFVSGLILIFEAPIQIGDTVEVGTLMGKVVQIGIRTSRVRTFGGSEVIVPNGDLVSNQVVNWTLSDRRRRLELSVGVAYGTDPTQVTELLKRIFEADEDVLDDPAPIIVFEAFGDSSLNFRMLVWIADFDNGFSMTHRLNTAINAALAEAGITIPFPQRDLHVTALPAETVTVPAERASGSAD